jgi:hypothetical protein
VSQTVAPRDLFCLNDNVALESFDDGALVLRLHDRHIFELNSTARDILNRTDGNNSVADIVSSMAKEYHAPEEELLADVSELLAQFVEQGLVKKCPDMH